MNDFETAVIKLAQITPLPEDYTGEDGLLYCGRCRKVKQFRMEDGPMAGKLFPRRDQCVQEKQEQEEATRERRRHLNAVDRLRHEGFSDAAVRDWTFANDSGKKPQMKHARFYVNHWDDMKKDTIGYLLWGGVGTGKSYFSGCIANALMEREASVRMTNCATILNDLAGPFNSKSEYMSHLCRFSLEIIDEFGMEHGTEYGLEQVCNVIDSRYRSGKPLIVTTNLSFTDLQHPQSAHRASTYITASSAKMTCPANEPDLSSASSSAVWERQKNLSFLNCAKKNAKRSIEVIDCLLHFASMTRKSDSL